MAIVWEMIFSKNIYPASRPAGTPASKFCGPENTAGHAGILARKHCTAGQENNVAAVE
jgi:hypothetical protein